MAEQRYPIGIQSFPKLVKGGYTYVDKTAFIAKLVKGGQYIFLSRPRRFGKSLLLSTMQAYYEGRRELFKGLVIDGMDVDWTPRPVLCFNLNSGLYDRPTGLEERLDEDLTMYEARYGVVSSREKNVVTRFGTLIREVWAKTGQQVIVLVDEYDKPLLDIEENPEQFENNQRVLKGFFSNLKSMDEYIEFGMMTGVSRFSKVSIFSDLNNLDDISLDEDYAAICGWSEDELLCHFRTGIERLATEREENFDTTLRALRNYYDGYLFTQKGARLYNPFSVLKALNKRVIDPYWFDSATPTFLAKRIRRLGIFPGDIDGQRCTREELIAVGLNDRNPIPLMFQTGYLTIGSYNTEANSYELRFPNREVEIGFFQQLLPMYAPATEDTFSPFSFPKFKIDLVEGRPEEFMRRLGSLFKSLPGEDHNESVYRAVTLILAELCTTQVTPERHSYKGRSDLEVCTSRYVYLFEFKYNRSVKEAMDQIRDRDYAGRYAMDGRQIFLIGANFNENKNDRGLEWEIA